jgi:hypothetical protein
MAKTPFAPPDVAAYLLAARRDPAKVAAAWALVRALSLFEREPKTRISRSDCGRCALDVWAEIHGRYDLPDAKFAPRDRGTLTGAWRAALLKVEIESRHDDVLVALEHESDYRGVVGHSDLIVCAKSDALLKQALWVWEAKDSAAFTIRPPHEPGKTVPPNTHHVLQTALGALSVDAPDLMVSTFGPSAGADPPDDKSENHSEYDVDSWKALVDEEIDRLRTAERKEPPPADPRFDYQCEGCRYSACSRNRNPLKPAPDLAALLEASVAL